MRSVSASSAAIWLNDRASVPISSCDVAVTRCEKSPRAIASVAATISRSGDVSPRDRNHTTTSAMKPGDHAAQRRPHAEPDAHPEHDDGHRDRGEDHDAQLELERRERIERPVGRALHLHAAPASTA